MYVTICMNLTQSLFTSSKDRRATWAECGGTCGFFKTLSPLLASPCTHGTVLTVMRVSNSLLTSCVFTLVSLFMPQHSDARDGLGKLWTAEAKTLFQKAMQLLLNHGHAWFAYTHPGSAWGPTSRGAQAVQAGALALQQLAGSQAARISQAWPCPCRQI